MRIIALPCDRFRGPHGRDDIEDCPAGRGGITLVVVANSLSHRIIAHGHAIIARFVDTFGVALGIVGIVVGIITLLRYDVGATSDFFSGLPMQEQTSISIWMDRLNWLELVQRSVPLYLLLGMSFVLCACICYPVGQLCGKLLSSTESLNQPLMCSGSVTTDHTTSTGASIRIERSMRCGTIRGLPDVQPLVA